MKKRKSSRLTKMLYLFFAAVIVCNLFATAVSATTIGVWRHTATGVFTNGSKTSYRPKLDDSSSYTFNDRSSCSVAVYVFGSYYPDGTYETNDSARDYGTAVAVGEKGYIPNYVYEYGRPYAALQFWTPDYSYESINVLWSPDTPK